MGRKLQTQEERIKRKREIASRYNRSNKGDWMFIGNKPMQYLDKIFRIETGDEFYIDKIKKASRLKEALTN